MFQNLVSSEFTIDPQGDMRHGAQGVQIWLGHDFCANGDFTERMTCPMGSCGSQVIQASRVPKPCVPRIGHLALTVMQGTVLLASKFGSAMIFAPMVISQRE